MNQFEVKFLGTGNAIPTQLRNHTSILIELENESFLVDCGEGTQRQFKVAKISQHKITKIFITHWHGDHILGIPGLLQTLAMTDYKKQLNIYGPEGTLHFMGIVRDLISGIKINVRVHEVKEELVFESNKLKVIAEKMIHDSPALAYSFILKDTRRLEKKKLKKYNLPNSPILKQLQQGKDIVFNGKKIKANSVSFFEKGKKLTIILDTAMNENAVALAKDSDLLIAESSFSSEEKEKAKEYKHLTASEAATIAKKARVKELLLTHISQRYEHCPEKLQKEARKIFKKTKLAKDFDKFVI